MDGIGGVLADWITISAPVAWAPDLSTLAAATALGSLYAGRYVSECGIGTQIYALGIACDAMALSHVAAATYGIDAVISSGPAAGQLSVWKRFDGVGNISGNACTAAVSDWFPLLGRDCILCLSGNDDLRAMVAVARGDIVRGSWSHDLLTRFVFVPADCERAKRTHYVPATMPPDIARALRTHAGLALGDAVRKVTIGTNACDMFDDARPRLQGGGAFDSALWVHAETNAMKLAMISAISRDPVHPRLGQDDADFGIRIVSRGIAILEKLIAES